MQAQSKAKELSTLSHNQELKNKCRAKPETMSINHLYNQEGGSECSYCHKGKSYSHGLINKNFSPYTYLVMMQRGWRRCGTYYYKLDLAKSCCKQWTHRLNVNNFKIKKDQKKTIKKLITLCYQPVAIQQQKKQQKVQKQKQKPCSKITIEVNKYYKDILYEICQKINEQLKGYLKSLIPANNLQANCQFNFQFLNNLKFFTSPSSSKANYYCNYGMLIYGSNKKKLKTKEYPIVDFIKDVKTFVQKVGSCDKYKVQLERTGYLLVYLSESIKLQKSQQFQIINEEKIQVKNQSTQKIKNKIDQQTFIEGKKSIGQNILSKIKQKVNKVFHNELQKEPAILEHKQSSNKFQLLEPTYKGQLRITADSIKFGKLTIKVVKAQQKQESYRMYTKYCQQIHQKEQKSMSSYTNFLCQKALVYEEFIKKHLEDDEYQKYYIPSFDPSEKYQKRQLIQGQVKLKLGCFHMKYYLSEKLIAVGVVDILPTGLSSVYFFYEPQYKNYRLGVFSSLIQIEYVRYMQLSFPEFKNYYMGFYIHNNQKMSYKGDYQPYQLLCPVTYNFVQVDKKVKQKVDKIVKQGQKIVRLADKDVLLQKDMNFGVDLGVYIDKNIKLTYKNRPLKLNEINPTLFIPVLTLLKLYISIWGKQLFDIFTFTF